MISRKQHAEFASGPVRPTWSPTFQTWAPRPDTPGLSVGQVRQVFSSSAVSPSALHLHAARRNHVYRAATSGMKRMGQNISSCQLCDVTCRRCSSYSHEIEARIDDVVCDDNRSLASRLHHVTGSESGSRLEIYVTAKRHALWFRQIYIELVSFLLETERRFWGRGTFWSEPSEPW